MTDAGVGQALVAAAATVLEPQQGAWTRTSSSSECAALQPPPQVPPALSWTAPSGTLCDPTLVNGSATVAFSTWTATSAFTSPMFIQPDGTAATFAFSQASGLVSGTRGLWLFHSPGAGCTLATLIENGAIPSATLSLQGNYPLVPNPRGGYVESRAAPDLDSIQLRWLDDDLQPLGDWHTIVTRKAGYNSDDRGRS